MPEDDGSLVLVTLANQNSLHGRAEFEIKVCEYDRIGRQSGTSK